LAICASRIAWATAWLASGAGMMPVCLGKQDARLEGFQLVGGHRLDNPIPEATG
jgi:hypothetical protein